MSAVGADADMASRSRDVRSTSHSRYHRATSPCPLGAHNATSRLSIFTCKRLRDFAGGVDKKPCDGAERAIRQSDDSAEDADPWEFNGQNFQFRALGGKPQCRSRKHCQKA